MKLMGCAGVNEQQDIVNEFLVESYENLDQLDRDLLTLERDPASRPTLSSIFRTIHTIKGTCGFLGFSKLESVAHVGESLLSKLRDGQLALRPEITNGLLGLVDAVRELLGNIETIGAEGEGNYATLIQRLIRLQERELLGCAGDAAVSHESVVAPCAAPGAVLLSAAPERSSELPANTEDAATAQGTAADRTIRVDVCLLDKLMNHVGELVLTRNQMLQFAGSFSDTTLLNASQRLNTITTELQEGVMRTRMQPIGNIWNKFPRVVRDLAAQCGKQVRIAVEGKETELDKTIIEAIKDPLTHLVRNAVDHGIELPAVRAAAGKPPEGCLLLRAFHEGGQVNIEISDDGGGLNIDCIRSKALERKVITPEQAKRMSDREITQLILAPGFSTAEKVTNVSGRGVGMDVVKTNVEKIGGTLDIQSSPGLGTTVKLKIPLTLAIIPALIVTCGGQRYAIPQASLLELVRLREGEALKAIEYVHGTPVYRLRGRLLPLVFLQRELGLQDTVREAVTNLVAALQSVHIVVLRADDRQFGLVVDAINDSEEIVVKSLSKQLRSIPVYAGTTIMGDGKVALILDVRGTAQRAGVVSENGHRELVEQPPSSAEKPAARQTLLIFELGDRRLALPLEQVSRLEVFPSACIEKAGSAEVVQYRGQILPLLRLGSALGLDGGADPEAPLPVIVCSRDSQNFGLVVDRITDIVDTALEAAGPQSAAGRAAVIQRRVTSVLDVASLADHLQPGLWPRAGEELSA
jgi:two-component system, chemotaxis family, sensor kinase CheA